MLTIAAMTLSGLGGGAVVGWVNIPHAAAVTPVPAAPAVPVVVTADGLVPTYVHPPRAAAAPVKPKVVASVKAPTPVAPVSPPTTAATHRAASEQQAVQTALSTRNLTPATTALASGGTCGAAIAYLETHSAPGFSFECPGYALGHQAMTCVNVAGVCPGQRLIVISTVCQASYMNEANNSWIVAGYRSGTIDPYGYCP